MSDCAVKGIMETQASTAGVSGSLPSPKPAAFEEKSENNEVFLNEGEIVEEPIDALPCKIEGNVELMEICSEVCEIEDNNNNKPVTCDVEQILGSISDTNCTPMTQLSQLFEGPIGYDEDFDKTPTVRTLVYGCGICFTIVGCSQESFQLHQKAHHKLLLKCKVCKRKYATKKGYENHMMTHIRYPCLHCPKEFRHLIEVEEHQRKHFPQKLLRCEMCGQEFYLQASLKQHRSFMGDQCVEIQRSARKIQQQLVTMKSEELVKCVSGCSNMIPKSRMEEHINYHYNKTPWAVTPSRKIKKKKRYECDVCGDEFKTSNSLHAHKSEHEDEDDPDTNTDSELGDYD